MGDGTFVVRWEALDELRQFGVDVDKVREQIIFPPPQIRVTMSGGIVTDNCKFRKDFGTEQYSGS